MAEDNGTVETEKKDITAVTSSSESLGTGKKKQRGILSWIWNGIFSLNRKDDFEKRLQHISKEEANVLARMKRRSHTWRRLIRQLIVISVICEVLAVIYAIMTTRSMDLNWKMRAFRVLPMFLLPGLSSVAYSAIISFTRMRDRKDQKTLERLRSERQAKIDELKERTNYYITQQLIQRYDPDPAAKAAAATVLASKLGADSGLKLYVGDESKVSTGRSNDIELVQSTGLRNRKQVHSRSSSLGVIPMHQIDEKMPLSDENEAPQILEHKQLVVDHGSPQGLTSNDGGWIARIAALLVGEDPTQSYALICGNCHVHNGLARKEEYPFITYYCPHCNALNRAKQSQEVSGSSSANMILLKTAAVGDQINNGSTAVGDQINNGSTAVGDSALTSNSPVNAGSEIEEPVASGNS